ncbi:MAG: hypothetical protein H5T96_05400 [Tissierellales bacterium]|jgi:hypothetical protein|nr:hypothetical protein [Tissierellales bacterium]
MDDYKQLISEKVKAEIENSIAKVLEGEGSLESIIDSVAEIVNEIGIKTFQEITSQLNENIEQAPEKNDIQKEK